MRCRHRERADYGGGSYGGRGGYYDGPPGRGGRGGSYGGGGPSYRGMSSDGCLRLHLTSASLAYSVERCCAESFTPFLQPV